MFIALFISILAMVCPQPVEKVVWFKINDLIHVNEKNFNQLDIYCFAGKSKIMKYLLSSAQVKWKFHINKPRFILIKGSNISEIKKQLKNNLNSWYSLYPSSNTYETNFNIYEPNCIGLHTKHEYDIKFIFLWFDINKLRSMGIAGLIFIIAPILSRNIIFYYLFSIILGNLASLLILIYICSKFFPQHKNLSYVILIGGWSTLAFILRYMWENFQYILYNYKNILIGYVMLISSLTFLYCYYKGPPQNPKVFRIIQWAIQIFCLFAMYLTMNYKPATLLPMAILILENQLQNSKYSLISRIRRCLYAFYRRRFPPKIKLLTEEEYQEQGLRETAKQLEKLQAYCRSAECIPWKLTQKLKYPSRFASFIEGAENHVSQDETFEWEQESSTKFNRSAPSALTSRFNRLQDSYSRNISNPLKSRQISSSNHHHMLNGGDNYFPSSHNNDSFDSTRASINPYYNRQTWDQNNNNISYSDEEEISEEDDDNERYSN